jgi:broad specificity phosphatase PhoE
MATTIYLIRHCSYQNPEKIIAPHLPGYALDNQGKIKAQKIANFFKENSQITKIYSSPIQRAEQTAQIIAKKLNLKPLISPWLIETTTPFSIMKKKDYDQNYSRDIYYQKEHFLGGGESIEQINRRMIKFMEEVLRENPNDEIIAVSHGDPIMVYFLSLTNQSLEDINLRKDYISMGGMIKLVFDKDHKLESFEQINLS